MTTLPGPEMSIFFLPSDTVDRIWKGITSMKSLYQDDHI